MEHLGTSDKRAKSIAITLFLICGTMGVLSYKLMGSQEVQEGGHQKMFFHPYMQSFTLFVGQSLCLILYVSNLKKNKIPLEPGKTPHSFRVFIIPALADACSSILQYIGMVYISGSTYMMFKGAILVTTALFSKILFKMKLERRHIVGGGLALAGLVVVGLSELFDQKPGQQSEFSKEVIGYAFMIVSLFFNGFLYAYEQLLMRKHSINPMEMVGGEGVFGMIFVMLIAMTFSMIPCIFPQKNCVFDSHGYMYMERVDMFFKQVFTQWLLGLLVLSGILSLGVYNLNGVRITKLFDGLTRSLLNITKTLILWIAGIIITVSIGSSHEHYKIESLNLSVIGVKSAGFTVIVIGTLIYNQLIFKSHFLDSTQVNSINAELIQNPQGTEQNLKESLISQEQKPK